MGAEADEDFVFSRESTETGGVTLAIAVLGT
jgi:hypothetical protein